MTVSCSKNKLIDRTVHYPFGAVKMSPWILVHPYCADKPCINPESAERIFKPGYCSVYDRRAGVKVECTLGLRSSWHRVFWKIGEEHLLRINTDELGKGKIVLSNENNYEITGYGKRYMVMAFSREFESIEFENDSSSAVISFGRDGGPVIIKTGYSCVCIKNARNNMFMDGTPYQLDFDRISSSTQDKWRTISNIELKGGTKSTREKFVMDLQATATLPILYSDPKGWFIDSRGCLERAVNHSVYELPQDFKSIQEWVPLASLLYVHQLQEFAFSCYYMRRDSMLTLIPETIPVVSSIRNRGLLEALDHTVARNTLGERHTEMEFPTAEGGAASRVLSCMGLIPDREPEYGYTLTRPAFRYIRILLASGYFLTITVSGMGDGAPECAVFNNRILKDNHISLQEISVGGDLVMNY